MSLQVTQDTTALFTTMLPEQLSVGLDMGGDAAERFAKENLTRNSSVITGRLRASVTHQVVESEKAVYIGPNVYYAPYVELGTVRSKPKPYLKPAATGHGSPYRQVLENALAK